MAKRQDGTEGHGRRLRFFCRCAARSGCYRICYSGSIPESSPCRCSAAVSRGIRMYCILKIFPEGRSEYSPRALRASPDFPKWGIVFRSSLRFLPVFFPVFARQIAGYLPRKNGKTSSEEIPESGPGKITIGFDPKKLILWWQRL